MNKSRKELIGKVVSDKSDKTITILVETSKKHPLYKKRMKVSKKYLVHDPKEQAKMGDTVKVIETKPLSKNKRYELVSIVEKAVIL